MPARVNSVICNKASDATTRFASRRAWPITRRPISKATPQAGSNAVIGAISIGFAGCSAANSKTIAATRPQVTRFAAHATRTFMQAQRASAALVPYVTLRHSALVPPTPARR